MNARRADKAGSWYPASADALGGELDGYLRNAALPADLPSHASVRMLAAVVPHAGLVYSGPTAAYAYRRIHDVMPDAETFLIFGAVHTMALECPCFWTDGPWQTPLGDVEIDHGLSDALLDAGVGIARDEPHAADNAIELQLPFIKHLFPEAKMVAVATPPTSEVTKAGETARKVVEACGKRVVVLGSTDLTHYGRGYGFAPAGTGRAALAWAEKNDRRQIDCMTGMDAEAVVPTAQKDRSACGAGAVAATVAYARAAGAVTGTLIKYSTSHDLSPDEVPSMFVGYAAVVFEQAVS